MTQAGKYHRRWRNYLVDPKVQLKFALIMVVITTVLTAGLGFFWYAEVRTTSNMLRVNALSSLGPEVADKIEQEVGGYDHKRLAVLVGFGLLLALLSAGYGIFITHKVAGPIFKMTRHMKDIEANRIYPLWGLRKGDQLQEFFAAFQDMHASLRERTEKDMILLNQVIAAIDRGDGLEEMMPRIRERVVEKGDSLRDASDVTQQIRRDTGAPV
ncbi:MAG: hypothetical protein JRH20_23010 [Deltaproteobacteria bacterium]|nr:hypothetical protein [Deltaproteobacteria bacterium]